MFGMDSMVLAFVALAGCSAGAIAYAFLFNRMANREERREAPGDGQEGRNRPLGGQGLARPACRSRQAQEVGPGFAEGARREEEGQEPSISRSRRCEMQIRQAGMQVDLQRFYIYSVVCGVVLTLCRFLSRRADDRAAWRAAGRRDRPAALVRVVPPRPPGQGVPQRIPQRARRDRARRQIRPASERRHPPDRERGAGAGEDRIPAHRRGAAGRPVDPRGGDAHGRDHALPGGRTSSASSSRSRARPAAICRRRSAIFRACCATARR